MLVSLLLIWDRLDRCVKDSVKDLNVITDNFHNDKNRANKNITFVKYYGKEKYYSNTCGDDLKPYHDFTSPQFTVFFISMLQPQRLTILTFRRQDRDCISIYTGVKNHVNRCQTLHVGIRETLDVHS